MIRLNKSPLNKKGYDWIVGKSIHWGENIVFYPWNPDKIFIFSENGVFCCDNNLDKKNVKFYFEPKGQERKINFRYD